MATLRRGGMVPHAEGSPAERRAPRAGRRRRPHLRRTRAARLAPVPQTHRQSTRPAIGQTSADPATREGVAERCEAPAVPQTLAVARALRTSDDQRRSARARFRLHTAQHHEAPPLSRSPTGPGMGTILRRVLLDALHPRDRVPRVQACASYCRRLPWAQASGGNRGGTSGNTRGHAPLPGHTHEAKH
jgi:hypothetical protein